MKGLAILSEPIDATRAGATWPRSIAVRGQRTFRGDSGR
jgi:hypothetical protein